MEETLVQVCVVYCHLKQGIRVLPATQSLRRRTAELSLPCLGTGTHTKSFGLDENDGTGSVKDV